MSAMENSDQLWAEEPAPEAAGVPMADWWRRFAALVIDIAIISIPLGIVTRDMGRIPGFFVGAAVGVTYFALLNGGRRGQTLGKMVWDVRVRDAANGGPLGVPKAAIRYLAPTLLFLIPIRLATYVSPGFLLWVVDGLWPLWDRQRQAVHDKLAGSMVVRAN
jgi:uncharacterized RDD family membrane protein YckC